MTHSIWKDNVDQNRNLVENSSGPNHFIVVTGTQADYLYWKDRLNITKSALFAKDNSTHILSVHENTPKGNFLGTLNAWQHFLNREADHQGFRNNVVLTSMLFGKGIRLSPFTQVLSNCKSRLPTPAVADNNVFLNVGELSNLYSNLLVEHLRRCNFRGMLVKWGDEIVLPGISWSLQAADFTDTDAVRFIWFTEPTPELAREKEWMLVDPRSGEMKSQFARQEIGRLLERVKMANLPDHRLGVNLGSLAISYDFLDLAARVFSEDIQDPTKLLDWDPHVWVALSCDSEEDWKREILLESQNGGSGLAKLDAQFPHFFTKISLVKKEIEKKKGRPFSIKAIDYGPVFWTDFGQHIALRKTLQALLSESDLGIATRELFYVPQQRDAHGNIIVNSEIHPRAAIHNSLVINSSILSAGARISAGIVIGSHHQELFMPAGGISLFSSIRHAFFDGPNALTFYSIADTLRLPEGGRHSTLVLPDRIFQLFASESILDYKGSNFENPILNNPISFAEASRLIGQVSLEDIERLRKNAEAAING